MEWFCAVFNSDKVNSAIGAQILYEKLCEGDSSLVGDLEDIIDKFCNELMSRASYVHFNKFKGYVIIACEFKDAEFINDLVMDLSKKNGLSFYEPQNMTYQF
ncbi:MAG: hypothetical protein Q4F66_03180 [Clostridium sp.]|nr:hypothetical protein [Clostridium sp.]